MKSSRLIKGSLALAALIALTAATASGQIGADSAHKPDIAAGKQPNGDYAVPTKQILHVFGETIAFPGRPVDLALSRDGKEIYIKNWENVLVVDVASWKTIQTNKYPASPASPHGIRVSRDGSRLYATGVAGDLYEWKIGSHGKLALSRTILLPTNSASFGLALSPDNATAYVCLGRSNALAVVNLAAGTVTRLIRTGVAPWDVTVSSDGATAYVSDWGGRIPRTNDLTGDSIGTRIVVDSRGIAASGTVSVVDLKENREVAEIPTDLHPCNLVLSPDGNTLFVANANSDTVTVIDTHSRTVSETIPVRPDPKLPFGSATDGLALSADGTQLFVACGGNNAIGIVEPANNRHTNSALLGFVPTDWYPGALAADTKNLYVVNVKGRGSRNGDIYQLTGTADKIPTPSPETLAGYTAAVERNSRVREILETQLPAISRKPVPVPVHVGEPSVFKHVLYIVKENKTYDQMFGDILWANGATNLCVFPKFVTPNHHALAIQFVLLDNYYCNGVYSTDGHAWATEANATDYWEKSLGIVSRSGTQGNDPLMYSSSGFIWDNVLEHGLTFYNYGLMSHSFPQPSSSWQQVYADYTNRAGRIWFTTYSGDPPPLHAHTTTNVSGFNLAIPDQVRVEGFLKEFQEAENSGVWPNFNILYLPDDHTVGGSPNFPTPRAMVADNDLALGRAIDAVSHSRFWRDTVIFVIEDDPQSGYDHVDGHRSICLVVSPYTWRSQTISVFYNQTGLIHTMEQIMGLPPMNQFDAMGPLMTDCFMTSPDYTPYTCLTNNVPLDEMNPGTTAAISSKDRYWAKLSLKQDFSKPDAANDDTLNRIIWHSIRGDSPYPAEWTGAHGKGLKKLGLALSKTAKGDGDD